MLTVKCLSALPGCDWHHHFGGGSSGGPPDPEAEAFVVGLFVAAAIGVLLSPLSGGLMVVVSRKIRHTFWALPAVNLVMYLVFMLARDYPGGNGEQFRGWGLVTTLGTILLLLILSLIFASIIALIRYVVRAVRGRRVNP